MCVCMYMKYIYIYIFYTPYLHPFYRHPKTTAKMTRRFLDH